MSKMKERAGLGRRVCPVIFLLDTSGSMFGAPIGAVNEAMEGVLKELISMNEDNADNEINIAIMSFGKEENGNDVKWVTGDDGLKKPEEVKWCDLDADDLTPMGAAFGMLNRALSVSRGFMNRASGSVAPVLFLLSDGEPSDDYQNKLSELKENNWYKIAARVAIGYGESNDAILAEFTGNRETVLHTNDPAALKKLIKFVTITSSTVASKGTAATDSGDVDSQDGLDDMTSQLAEEFTSNPPTLAADDGDFGDW